MYLNFQEDVEPSPAANWTSGSSECRKRLARLDVLLRQDPRDESEIASTEEAVRSSCPKDSWPAYMHPSKPKRKTAAEYVNIRELKRMRYANVIFDATSKLRAFPQAKPLGFYNVARLANAAEGKVLKRKKAGYAKKVEPLTARPETPVRTLFDEEFRRRLKLDLRLYEKDPMIRKMIMDYVRGIEPGKSNPNAEMEYLLFEKFRRDVDAQS